MKKFTYFDTYWGEGWPDTAWLQRYFLSKAGQEWTFETQNDGGNFSIEGVDGTSALEEGKGRIDINLVIDGKRGCGAMLYYRKSSAGLDEDYFSRGDVSQMRRWVRNMHGTPLSLGFFIPFASAWTAVREFMDTDGRLPKSISWINQHDIPADVFPDP